MSMKRLALIAAVSSHHTSHITTKIITQTIAVSAPSATTTASTGRTITDDSNLNLNATGIGKAGRAAGGGGGGGGAGVSGLSPVWQNIGWAGGSGSSGSGRSENVNSSVSYSGSISGNSYFTQDVSKGSELYQGHQAMRPGATLHGNVNVLLGGAMLSVVITVVCVVCYCCHRNIKKRSEDSMYRQQRWIDNTTAGMEIYSVEQCYEASRLYGDSIETTSIPLHLPAPHSGPPPSYDSVLAMDEFIRRPSPPPKYHQHPRQPCRTCCTMARQASVARSTCTLPNCRKHNHTQHHHRHQRSPSLPDRASRSRIACACLNLNEQAQLGHTSEADPTLVPTAIDSLDNKTHVQTNANSQSLDSLQPERECHTCQLCGKLQRTSAAINQMRNANLASTRANDIANGNVEETVLCSCDTFEFVLNYNNAADELIHSEDTEGTPKIQIDHMNNVVDDGSLSRNNATGERESTQFELDSNFNQANPSRQQSHYRNENNNHQQQLSPRKNERQTTNHQQHHHHQHLQHQQQQTHNLAALDTFNENGIIRMDMSQIIDRTGLPTYEAAIKLESSGYV